MRCACGQIFKRCVGLMSEGKARMSEKDDPTAVEQLLQAVLRQSRERLHTIDHMTSFLLDPSAGPLSLHQKSVVMKIVRSARDIEELLDETERAYRAVRPPDRGIAD